MKYINTNWDIPYYNFALEEYLLTDMPEDSYVFFYIHKPSIIVGKHQNTIEEINQEFVTENNILVARRMSGGGAVYHDTGNLNFSFVHKADKNDINNFAKFTKPVIEALKELGVNAQLSGRNDILINDKKISGNAQFYTKGRILHHGTLLFDSDMSNLSSALKVKEIKIKSKGIKSVRSRVTNIKEHINNDMNIFDLKEFLLKNFGKSSDISEYKLSEKDLSCINEIAIEKFSTWDWNWGRSPEFEIQKINKFPCGIIDMRFNIKNGIINDCKTYGDFFAKEDVSVLENLLIGKSYRKENLKKILSKIDMNDYFSQISLDEFLNFIFN